MGRMKRALGAAASYQYAEINARLGKANDAFANLEVAIVAKDPGLSTLKVDPLFDALRGIDVTECCSADWTSREFRRGAR